MGRQFFIVAAGKVVAAVSCRSLMSKGFAGRDGSRVCAIGVRSANEVDLSLWFGVGINEGCDGFTM